MPRPIVKFTLFAFIVALILWVIARVKAEMEGDPFDVEN
jgi:hypothetical protein